MVGRDAIITDGLTMLLGGIAFVLSPVILWIFLGQLVHIIIAIGLGQNRGCCNCQVFAVAFYNSGVGQYLSAGCILLGLETVAVDNDSLRTYLELIKCTMHSED